MSGFVFPSRNVIAEGQLPCFDEQILDKAFCLGIKCLFLAKCQCCGELTCYLGSIERTYGTEKVLQICYTAAAETAFEEEKMKRRRSARRRTGTAHA